MMCKKGRDMMIDIRKVWFGDVVWEGGNEWYQDILYKREKEVIGCLVSRKKNMLTKVEEVYQRNVDVRYKNVLPDFGYTDDDGRILAKFRTLRELVDFINEEENDG
jgi:hypothetical protein